MTLPIHAGTTVLVREPGPRASETIHSLVDAGARVDVLATGPDARLADLASRGLVRVLDEADLTAYDVVVRDPHPDAGHAGDAATGSASGGGRVVLVGGGPGAPGLLTLAGLEAIRSADVIVTDRLAPLGALEQARPDAEIVHVGKIPRGEFTPQERINDVLLDHALRGKVVVRFKGGDSFVFGRGGEEWNACVEAGVPVDVIPGVTSSVAVPALAGIPVTHRTRTQGFVVVSGHVGPDDPRSDLDWPAIARSRLTIVILMGVAALPEITAALVEAGLPEDTPAACIADGGLPAQRVCRATVLDLASAVEDSDISAPAVTVIGTVVDALEAQP